MKHSIWIGLTLTAIGLCAAAVIWNRAAPEPELLPYEGIIDVDVPPPPPEKPQPVRDDTPSLFEPNTPIRRAYADAVDEWRREHRLHVNLSSEYCRADISRFDDDYLDYCGRADQLVEPPKPPEMTGGTAVPEFARRVTAPFMAQIVFSETAEQELNLAEIAPDWEPWERTHVCGGALIAPNWVLTAAHCIKFDRPDYFSVRADIGLLSEEAGYVLPVTRLVLHPDYDPTTHFNDIALLELGVSDTQLDLGPPPFETRGDYQGAPGRRRLEGVDLLDESRALLTLSDGRRQILDLREAIREELPGLQGESSFEEHIIGDGLLILWRENVIFILSDDLQDVRQFTYSEPIASVDVDPQSGEIAVLGRDGRLTLFDARLNPGMTSDLSGHDFNTVSALGRGEVRLETRWPHSVVDWRVGETEPIPGSRNTAISGVGRFFHDFPGQPYIQDATRADGTASPRFLFPDGRHRLDFDDGRIRLIQNGSEAEFRTSIFPAKLTMHPDGRYLVALGEDRLNPNGPWGGEVHDMMTRGVAWSFQVEPQFLDSNVTFINQGRQFVLWDSEGRTEIRDFVPGAGPTHIGHSGELTQVRLSQDDRSVARTNIGTFEVTDLSRGEVVARIHPGHDPDGSALSGNSFLTWTRSGNIRVWDLAEDAIMLHYRVRPGGDVFTRSREGLDPHPTISLVHLSETRPQETPIETVQLFGWGKKEKSANAPPSRELRMIGMRPIDWDECIEQQPPTAAQAAESLRTGIAPALREEMRDPKAFCARAPERKSCTGDSGGPVTYQGRLIGIVSRGSGVCKSDDRTSTYTSVASFRDWVQGTVCPTLGEQGSVSDDAYPGFCIGFVD